MQLRLLTVNAHKGFSPLNRRFVLPRLRACIHDSGADLVFLQEIVGQNLRHARRYFDWPSEPQHEYLAGEGVYSHAYGRNAAYTAGHHGNALLSRFPILHSERSDLSTNRLEQRGLLYAVVGLPGGAVLHCVCVHLGLFARSREKQYAMLADFISRRVPPEAPLAVAGDFNEWRRRRRDLLETSLGLADAALLLHGRRQRTFPSVLPALPLDRVYLRGLKPLSSRVLRLREWRNVSDHAALLVEAGFRAA